MHNSIDKRTIRLLLDMIFAVYGYDFRDYAPGTVRRRLTEIMRRQGNSNASVLLERAKHDPELVRHIAEVLSITVSSMFRDTGFFLAFRNKVIPRLHTYPFIRIWHSGCGLGEEVYSTAIILYEEGLYDKCLIYATDINENALQNVRQGIFPLARMREYTRNYIESGGKGSFSNYYTARYKHAIFSEKLKKNLVISRHDLAVDGPFNEFHVIMCRNVLIYFNKNLKARVHDLFHRSLIKFGFLALGREESIHFTSKEKSYEATAPQEKIYKKMR